MLLQLLHDLVQYFDSENITVLTETLVDMLTFDSCYSDPVKCKYRTTFLWQQRIFCQLVPIYVRHYNNLSNGNIYSEFFRWSSIDLLARIWNVSCGVSLFNFHSDFSVNKILGRFKLLLVLDKASGTGYLKQILAVTA